MKKLLVSLAFIFPFLLSFAQSNMLMIKSNSKGLYVEHKAAAKENFYSIGRLYHTHPKLIAAFNGLDMAKGLSLGQGINIPLTDTNFSQKVNSGVPVYYSASEKESLANISVKYKAPINNLRGWNDITTDNLPAGTKVIVGFLITDEMRDRVVTIAPKMLDAEISVSDVKKAEALKKQMEPELKKDTMPETVITKEADVKKEAPPKTETEIKKEAPAVVKEAPKKIEPEIKKEEPKKTEPVVVMHPEIENKDGAGYFKNNFYQQVKVSPLTKEQTVTSSIFKTASGWKDGKYYLLINDVEPGTIVKITNPTNSKTIFAKVLYAMDKIRENQGVDIRISDAAAATLAVSETDKFILKVNY